MPAVSANTTIPAGSASAAQCYTPAGAAAALTQFQTWATNCRLAASMLSRAEVALLPARAFPVYGATMEGPGADRLRRAVEDGISRSMALGRALGDLEHELNQIADLYDLKAQQVSAQIIQMQAAQPVAPHAEARP